MWSQGAERDALWEELKNFTPVGPPAEEGGNGNAPAPADEAPPADGAAAEANPPSAAAEAPAVEAS